MKQVTVFLFSLSLLSFLFATVSSVNTAALISSQDRIASPSVYSAPNLVQTEGQSSYQEPFPLVDSLVTRDLHTGLQTGTLNNLVVFFKFYDQPGFESAHSGYYYHNMFNTAANSVHNFFAEESGNQLLVNNIFVPGQTLTPSPYPAYIINHNTHPSDYYKPYSTYNTLGYPNSDIGLIRYRELFCGIINFMDANDLVSDALNIDKNNDGNIDNVTFVIQGFWGGYTNTLYYPRYGIIEPGYASLNGKQFRGHVVSFEDDTIGTQCQKLSRALGFPNLYEFDVASSPVFGWDVMGLGNGYYWGGAAPHSLVYMKAKYGLWCNMPETISGAGLYTLAPVATDPFAAYKIPSVNPNEYYMVEYRAAIPPFENHIPGNGLIVYRINTLATAGSYLTEPYEVYIYRPSYSGGNPNLAYYSVQAEHTAIHSFTDPAPLLSNNSDGGLIIMDVGNANTTEISFRLFNSLPKIWTGNLNTDWHNVSNWENGVPTSTDDVYIPKVFNGDFYPVLNTSVVQCRNLIIGIEAELTVQSQNLYVNGNLNVSGDLIVTGAMTVTVNGDVIWEKGGAAVISHTNAILSVAGDMEFQAGSNINITNGYIQFIGTGNSFIKVFDSASINHLRANKTAPDYLAISNQSTDNLLLYGNLYVESGTRMDLLSNYNLSITGSFFNTSGTMNGYFGTVRFIGNTAQTIQNTPSATSFINHLTIEKTDNATLTMLASLRINGNLTFTSGILNSNNMGIELGGNWTNNVGQDGFVEGTGTVYFIGSIDQYCSTSEYFYTLRLNKPAETNTSLIIDNAAVVKCARFTRTAGILKVMAGTFEAADLTMTSITGTYYAYEGGTILLTQDAANTINLNASLNILGGTMKIGGGNGASSFAYSANAALNMTGGLLEFTNQGITIPASAYSLSINLSGGTIRTPASYSATRSGANLNGGTLELTGSGDASVTLTNGCTICNLHVNKSSARTSSAAEKPSQSSERTNLVTAASDLTLTGTLTIQQGTFDMGTWNLLTYNGINVYGTLKKNAAGTIVTNWDFLWQSGSVANLTLCSLQCGRNWLFDTGCTVDLTNIPVTLNAGQPALITTNSAAAWFGELNITGVSMVAQSEFTLSTASSQTMLVKGILNISGNNKVFITGETLQAENNINVNSTCTLHIGPDGVVALANAKALTVNPGGTLETLGSYGHKARITHITGNYALSVLSGGNISAEYTTFEYMNINGVVVNSGALVNDVHSFHFCTFQNGQSGTNGRLLTITNNQILDVYGADFPTNTGTGNWNVYKNVNQGEVNFYNYTGNFGGESYDYDTYNRLDWTLGSLCELTIVDYWAISDHPYVCEENSYGIEISNQSANPTVAPIRIDLYCNREVLPAATEAGDVFIYLEPLAAWENISVEILPAPSAVATTWKSWFRVDRLNEIAEADDGNNGGGYVQTHWQALPVVTNPLISYDLGTNLIELSWTYPDVPDVNRFKIYRGMYDGVPFTELAGTSTTMNWSEPLTLPHCLYRIVAEKDMP